MSAKPLKPPLKVAKPVIIGTGFVPTDTIRLHGLGVKFPEQLLLEVHEIIKAQSQIQQPSQAVR